MKSVLLVVLPIFSYSFFSLSIVHAISNGFLSTVTAINDPIEMLYDTNMNTQIVPVSKESQPPFADPKTKDAEQFLPMENTYCNAKLVGMKTFQGYTIKAGTNNADLLYGTISEDLILGLDGNDNITGLGDGDIICGGKGHDIITGDGYHHIVPLPQLPGKDLIFGQEGNDELNGTENDDSLHGGPGNDWFYGHAGNDFIVGGDGDDWGTGAEGNDVIYGSNGNDRFGGREGIDKLYGGSGNDELTGDNDYSFHSDTGYDLLDGGQHYDECYHGYDAKKTKFLNCEVTGELPPHG